MSRRCRSARGGKNPGDRAFHRVVEIGIRENDVRRFAAEFQRYALEMFRRGFVDLAAADFSARERDLAHKRVRDQRFADLVAVTCDRIDNTFGETCLLEQTRKLEN